MSALSISPCVCNSTSGNWIAWLPAPLPGVPLVRAKMRSCGRAGHGLQTRRQEPGQPRSLGHEPAAS